MYIGMDPVVCRLPDLQYAELLVVEAKCIIDLFANKQLPYRRGRGYRKDALPLNLQLPRADAQVEHTLIGLDQRTITGGSQKRRMFEILQQTQTLPGIGKQAFVPGDILLHHFPGGFELIARTTLCIVVAGLLCLCKCGFCSFYSLLYEVQAKLVDFGFQALHINLPAI